ncbi:hypothetical protein GCM10020256_48480 [Streptomyces thermocoprophilus]
MEGWNGDYYAPENEDGVNYGPITVREATDKSVNSVYAQMVVDVGPAKVKQTAIDLGIPADTKELKAYPSMALGTANASVLDMAEAYATLANHGKRGTYTLVEKISRNGQDMELPKAEQYQAVSREAADTTTAILQSVVDQGTATAAQAAGRPAAGKTGTAEKDQAAWFAGYTPELATVVSVMGQDPDTAAHKSLYGVMGLPRINGGGAPTEIWAQFTRDALKGKPVSEFDLELQEGAEETQAPPSTDPGDDSSDDDSDQDGGTTTGAPPPAPPPPRDRPAGRPPARTRARPAAAPTPAPPPAAPRPPTAAPATPPTAAAQATPPQAATEAAETAAAQATAPTAPQAATAPPPSAQPSAKASYGHSGTLRQQGTSPAAGAVPAHSGRSVPAGRLQPHDGDQQQAHEEDPGGGDRLTQHQHADHRRTGRTDAHPHAVGGTDGKGTGGIRQQQHARDDAGAGEQARPQPGETLAVLHADRPADLQQTGDDKQDPGHDGHLRTTQRNGGASSFPSRRRR